MSISWYPTRLSRGPCSTIFASIHPPFSPSSSKTTMRWPPWLATPSEKGEENVKDEDKPTEDWPSSLNATDWSHYRDPRNVIPIVLLTATVLGSYSVYRSYLRRIPDASLIQPTFWRKRSLFGRVTRVGDGDNFRLFHTPGGRLAGWEWVPGRKVPSERADLKDNTVCAVACNDTLRGERMDEMGIDAA